MMNMTKRRRQRGEEEDDTASMTRKKEQGRGSYLTCPGPLARRIMKNPRKFHEMACQNTQDVLLGLAVHARVAHD